MSKLNKLAAATIGAAMALSASQTAHAGLVDFFAATPYDNSTLVMDAFGYDASVATTGNGFGAVTNLLTLQNPRTGTEEGAVYWDGSDNALFDPNGHVEPQIGKTSTHTLGSLGIDSSDELLVVWNPAEKGADPENSVADSALLFFDAAGNLILALELAGNPVEHGTQNNGVGGNGFAYLLEGAGIAAFDNMIAAAGASAGDIRIGMYALVGSAGYLIDNGPDTWTVRFMPGEDGETCEDLGNCPVPEPGPLGMLGLGLMGLYAVRRKYGVR